MGDRANGTGFIAIFRISELNDPQAWISSRTPVRIRLAVIGIERSDQTGMKRSFASANGLMGNSESAMIKARGNQKNSQNSSGLLINRSGLKLMAMIPKTSNDR